MKEKIQEHRGEMYRLLNINVNGEWPGGIQNFKEIPYENIQQLSEILGNNFLEERQNSSPSVREFLESLAGSSTETFFDGYVVGSERDDERVTIEAVTTAKTDGAIELCRYADKFSLSDNLYAWWD